MDTTTVYGASALSFMMLMYWLEHRGSVFILGFSLGCLLSSVYGFLAGTWPFGVIEAVWCVIALRRHAGARAQQRGARRSTRKGRGAKVVSGPRYAVTTASGDVRNSTAAVAATRRWSTASTIATAMSDGLDSCT